MSRSILLLTLAVLAGFFYEPARVQGHTVLITPPTGSVSATGFTLSGTASKKPLQQAITRIRVTVFEDPGGGVIASHDAILTQVGNNNWTWSAGTFISNFYQGGALVEAEVFVGTSLKATDTIQINIGP